MFKDKDDVEPAIKAEFDKIIDQLLAYAKEHKMGYVLAIGKYYPDKDQTLIVDSYHEDESCGLHALTKMLMQPGPIALNILASAFDTGGPFSFKPNGE